MLQRHHLPLHWASRTGQADMVAFHLKDTDVNHNDEVCWKVACLGARSDRLYLNKISLEHAHYGLFIVPLCCNILCFEFLMSHSMLMDCSQPTTNFHFCYCTLLLNVLEICK